MWLDPGTYRMVVSAADYLTLEIKEIEVRKGSDLRIDLEFSKARAVEAPAESWGSPANGSQRMP